MKKRIIAMLLCMIMLLTELPLTVLAQEYRQSKKLAEPASEQVTGAAGQQPEGEERTPAGDSAPAAEAMPSAEAQPKTDVSPFPEKQEDIVLNTEQGEIDYQQLWESQYPHGSFAFADYSGTIVEGATDGSDFLLIPLYRIGNTSGRATAYVTVTSPIYQNEDGTTNDSFALSFRRDATLEVEVANPIAYYQELAAPPLFAAEEDVTLELQDYVGETDFSGEADCPLTICPLLPDGSKLEAEHYAWQYRPVGSTWRTFADSDVQSLNVDYSQIFDENGIPTADYRMVFYRNDSVYCTPTLFTGDPYDPQEDLGQQIPQDLAPYEPLTFQRYEPEELYETVELELTFAGGEFVKYIRVRAKDDSEYSSNRMAILTVTETTGGQTCDIGPTYLITKQDDDLADRRPTQFVFETDETTTGSADNYAEVKVLRTGDTRYPATVKVSTEEGTAVEGEHYMRTEKEIAFAAGMTEATVSVPLLCEDSFSGEREFYLELTNSSDGDLASVGELNRTRVTISEDEMLTADRATDNGLTTNTLLQKNLNIQKVLAFSAGEEQYSKMKIGKSLLGESKEPVTLTVRSDAELVATAPKKLQSHAYEDKDKIRFKRTELKGEKSYEESADYWKDIEMPAGDSTEDGIYDVASLRDLIIPPTFKSNKTDMKKSIGNQAKEHFERNVTWPSLTPGGENRLSRGVIFTHNDKTTAPLKFTVPNVGAMYSHVYVDLSLPGSIGDVNRMGTMYSWVMPWVNINQKDDSSEDKPTEAEAYTNFNPVLHERQARIEEFYMAGTPEFVFERDVKLDEEKFTIRMGLTQNLREKFNNPGTGGSPTSGSITWQQISEMRLTRRVFKNTKSIGLIVHTANDENVNDQNPMNEMIYDDIRPRVELVKHESGINADGQLYVGSKLKVSMFNSGAFKPFKGQTAADSVFVTDQNGRILEVPVEQGADEDEYFVTMLWPGITQEDLDTNSYSINVVLERRQRVQIDIRPSLDREENGAVKTDETSIEEGWNRFLTTKDGKSTTITLTYAKRTVLEKPGDNAYQTCDCDEKNIFSPEMVVLTGDDRYQLIDPDQGGNGTCTFTDTALPGLKNIQSICFGLDHNDAIVMNGRLFHGDDTIMLESQDLSLELLNVIFYDSEYKGLDSVMNATIVKHQFYFDGNGNGRIDGYYNELSGLFILDEKSGDTLYCEDDGEIIDTLLAPEKNAEGKLCQYFMKTIYTMTPRALEADEEDEDKRAQVLPTLISAETQPGALSLLTEEQKSYRCLLASEADTQTFDFEKKTLGPKVNVKISSDEHIMYGAEATKQTFVDFPLGGNTHVYHELEPETIREFTGNLRVDFEDPECISWTDATGKDHIAENPNDYLGSFIDDTTYALYVQEQKKTVFDSVKDVEPESIAVGTVQAVRNGSITQHDDVYGSTDGSFSSENEGGGLGDGFDFDSQLQLPPMDISFSGATCTLMNNQIWISLNIPIAEKSKDIEYKEKDGEGREYYTDPSGNRVYVDKDNNTIEYTIENRRFLEDQSVKLDPNSDEKTVIYQGRTPVYTEDKSGKETTYTYEDRYERPFYTDSNNRKVELTDQQIRELNKNGAHFRQPGDTDDLGDVDGFPESYQKSEVWNTKTIANAFKNAHGTVSASEFFKTFFKDGDTSWAKERDEAKNGHSFTRKVSFSIAVKFLIVLERDNLNHEWIAPKQGAITVIGTFRFEMNKRLECAPIIYFFLRVTVSASLEFSIGYPTLKEVDLDDDRARGNTPEVKIPQELVRASKGVTYSDGTWTIPKDEYIIFKTGAFEDGFHDGLSQLPNGGNDYQNVYKYGFSMKAHGTADVVATKINPLDTQESERMEVFDSDGKETLNFMVRKKITEDEKAGGKKDIPYWIMIKGGNDEPTTVSELCLHDFKRNGMFSNLSLKLIINTVIQVGAGIGFSLVHFEMFAQPMLKLTISDLHKIYKREEYLSDVYWGVSWTVEIKVFFFSTTLEVVGIYWDWSRESRQSGWVKKSFWGWGGQYQDRSAPFRVVSINGEPVNETKSLFRPPENTSREQSFYDAYDPETEPANAIHPTDPDVCFDISGYSNNGNAFKLADHLDTGAAYRAINMDGRTYILYQIAADKYERDENGQILGENNPMNVQQLALSRVITEGEHPGIQNPVDPNAETPYILVDDCPSSEVKGTHDFSFGVDGDKLTVIWTGYKDHFSPDEQDVTEENSSQYLVTKSASIVLNGDPTATFSKPQIISQGSPIYRYRPGVCDDVQVYAETIGTRDEDARNNQLIYYLENRYGLSEQEILSGEVTEEHQMLAGQALRYQIDQPTRTAFGDGSKLVAVYEEEVNGQKVLRRKEGEIGRSNGEHVTDMAFDKFEGDYVALYTTDQDIYVNNPRPGEVITALREEDFGENTEYATVHRLYARKFTRDGGWQTPKILFSAIDYESCDTQNINECGDLTDGYYTSEGLQETVANPTINALKILRAKLDEGDVQTIFVFGKDDNAYLMRYDEIIRAMNGEGYEIEPLFDEQIGMDAALASDSDGNLVMVYRNIIDGTNSNAIFCAWWDRYLGEHGGWGEPYMLAMNRMSVLEIAGQFGLQGDDLQKALLGLETGDEEFNEYIKTLDERDQGGLDAFIFSNLAVLPTKLESTADDAEAEESETSEQLIILTSGILYDLVLTKAVEEKPGEDSELYNEFAVKRGKDHGLGIYAISFGSGEALIEKDYVMLDNADFYTGAKLYGKVGFTNVGSAAIRASSANPVTVQLVASNAASENSSEELFSQVLQTWEVRDSIPSGRSVTLTLSTNELTKTLPAGTRFYLYVSEDADYIRQFSGEPFTYSSDALYVIGGAPDIGVENATFQVTGATSNAATRIDVGEPTVTIETAFEVVNRGFSRVDKLRAQFGYIGLDGLFHPLDMTNAKFHVEEQTLIEKSQNALEDDRLDGIVELTDDTGKADLDPKFKRNVTGKFEMSKALFTELADEGIEFCFDVFSSADLDENGRFVKLDTHELVHGKGEINLENNALRTFLPQKTFIKAPAQVCLSLNNTLHTVVHIGSTKTETNIVVREISNGDKNWKPILGECYYDSTELHEGIVATALDVGTTVIQIEDTLTSSFCEIVVKVTDSGIGTNIFNDDFRFVFGENGWRFFDNAETIPELGTQPMNKDYIQAMGDNAKFSFETYAAYLQLFGKGKVEVTSDLPGNEPKELVLPEDEEKGVSFGNESGRQHTVTVRAYHGTILDKLLEVYPENPGTLSRTNNYAPMFYWDRSFPNTASMKTGEEVELLCYITTPTELTKVLWNGKPVPEESLDKSMPPMWVLSTSISKNGIYTLTAEDIEGNSTTLMLPVHWYTDGKTMVDAVKDCPDNFAHRIIVSDTGLSPVPGQAYQSGIRLRTENAGYFADRGLKVYAYTNGYNAIDPLVSEQRMVLSSEGTSGSTPVDYLVTNSGYYLIRAVAENGTWRQAVLNFNQHSSSAIYLEDNNTSKIQLDLRTNIHNAIDIPEEKTIRLFTDGTDCGTTYRAGRSVIPGKEKFAYLDYPYTLGGTYTFAVENYGRSGQGKTYSVSVCGVPLSGFDTAKEEDLLDITTNTLGYAIRLKDFYHAVSGGYIQNVWDDGLLVPYYELGWVRLNEPDDEADETSVEKWVPGGGLLMDPIILQSGHYRLFVRSYDPKNSNWPTYYISRELTLGESVTETADTYTGWNEWTQTLNKTEETHSMFVLQGNETDLWDSYWYIVKDDITTNKRIKINGTVHLVIPEGVTLKTTRGIQLTKGNTLHLHGGGTLEATTDQLSFYAGIGGGDREPDAGSLIVHGTSVTAKGTIQSAGIGGSQNGDGGEVIVYSTGKLSAKGGEEGAGIGGGDSGNGGSFTFYSGEADISSGDLRPNSPTGGGAGIGGGHSGSGGTVRIYGGKGTVSLGNLVNPANGAEVIGHGAFTSGVQVKSGSLKVNEDHLLVKADNSYRWSPALRVSVKEYGWDDETKSLTETQRDVYTTYLDENSETLNRSNLTANPSPDEAGWYTVQADLTLSKRLKVDGDIKLILPLGVTVRAPLGIEVGKNNSLSIYGEGKLIANAEAYDAAIGGTSGFDHVDADCGTVNIHGGSIEAVGGMYGAGIGGGNGCRGAFVNIFSGNVTARGGENAAGIGGGRMTEKSTGNTQGFYAHIYGGTVNATGGTYGAGIGGGENTVGMNTDIYGGNVTATGGWNAAGIGGGNGAGGGAVRICGGTGSANLDAGTMDAEPIGHGSATSGTSSAGTLEVSTDLVELTKTDRTIRWKQLPGVLITEYGWDKAAGKLTQKARIVEATRITSPVSALKGADPRIVPKPDNEGWYMVSGNLTFTERLLISGDVGLIIPKNVTVTASRGIEVPEGSSLSVYGEGTLIANASSLPDSAGIGGSGRKAGCGEVNIHGCTVSATGGENGAGIGSGGGEGAAASGTAKNGYARFYNGTVYATGGKNGAGIGGGMLLAGINTEIYGGRVKAEGGLQAAGIGGGYGGNGGKVTIFGGSGRASVNPESTSGAEAIGHGSVPQGGSLFSGDLDVVNDQVNLLQGDLVLSWQTGSSMCITEYSWDAEKNELIETEKNVVVVALEESAVNLTGSDPAELPKPSNEGWYAAMENLTFTGRPVVEGDVGLIIPAGVTVNAPLGIEVPEGCTLSIYGEGTLNANAGDAQNNAAIGSSGANTESLSLDGPASIVRIHGGEIIAVGGENGAGIGGGKGCQSTLTEIYHGDVTATGGKNAAGIGGGDNSRNLDTYKAGLRYTVTVYGGTVNATGGENGAGIGGGSGCFGAFVSVYGGDVTAQGGKSAAGIGGGNSSSIGVKVENTLGYCANFYDGTVNATGGENGAGIGGGLLGIGLDVTVYGGNVSATGGNKSASSANGGGAGIGSGSGNKTATNFYLRSPGSGSLTCYGGVVNAKGGTDGAGIGGGYNGEMKSFYVCGGTGTVSNGDSKAAQHCGNGGGASYYKLTDDNVDRDKVYLEEYGRFWYELIPVSVTMYSWNSTDNTLDAQTVRQRAAILTANDTELTGGSWYLVQNDTTIPNRLRLKGSPANIVIPEGVTLRAEKGIDNYTDSVEYASLNIYGGGTLIAGADSGYAAIGASGKNSRSGSVTIHGCTVEAVSSGNAPGIGGTVLDFVAYASTITATGAGIYAGIGGSGPEGSGYISIYRSTVTATGGSGGAGIGGGWYDNPKSSFQSIVLYDSEVTVVGGDKAPGIGYTKTVELHGGTLNATGAPGITGTNIRVYTGSLTATGKSGCAAIGKTEKDVLSIYGGTVTATGEDTGSDGIGVYQIEMQDGTLIAKGGSQGNGINAKYSFVTNGGSITATGGEGGKGIRSNGSAILRSGTVLAEGGSGGAGIYANNDVSFQNDVFVTAIGGSGGAGIGGSSGEDGCTVHVLGGTVYATGGAGAAGIGGGYGGSGGKCVINGGRGAALNTGDGNAEPIGRGGYDPATMQEPGSGTRTVNQVYLFSVESGLMWIDKPVVDVTVNEYAWDEEAGSLTTSRRNGRAVELTSDVGALNEHELSLEPKPEEAGWYTARSDLTLVNRLMVASGNTVNLYIPAGVTITAPYGIDVPETATLNIYGEGTLIADAGDMENQAGIEGGTLNIHGCTVTAAGSENGAGISACVTVYNGAVEAVGGSNGAGIGGGNHGSGDTLTVYGGNITATGGSYGAGIGGGYYGSGGSVRVFGGNLTANGSNYAAGIGGSLYGNGGSLIVSGGTVLATGGYYGAGIGGGYYGSGETVEIAGGSVTATGGANAAGIGGGHYGSGGNITISGGSVSVTGGVNAAGIGGGYCGSGGNITISGGEGTVTKNGDSNAEPIGHGAYDPTTMQKPDSGTLEVDREKVYMTSTGDGCFWKEVELVNITANVFSWDNEAGKLTKEKKNARAITLTEGMTALDALALSSDPATGETDWLTAQTDLTFENRIQISAGSTINLYIPADVTITASFGMEVPETATLNIYGEGTLIANAADAPNQAGIGTSGTAASGTVHIHGCMVSATGGENAAGIGGTVTVFNGTVEAVGGKYGAGIGGSSGSTGGNITVYGGTIITRGGYAGAGIGSGYKANGGSVSVFGGSINATGGSYASGIGAGSRGNGGTLTVYDGSVTAIGGYKASGIGGGAGDNGGGNGGTVIIRGGTVNVTGGTEAAGIGGGTGLGRSGQSGRGGTVEISGGTVTTTGGSWGAGIGGGDYGDGGSVTISGGTVIAKGGYYAAGIGSGGYCTTNDSFSITVTGGTVTATGDTSSAGIGGGFRGVGGSVTVYAGTVTANGGSYAAGIGAGSRGNGGTFTMYDGYVTATGGENGAGIGGGDGENEPSGNGGTVVIRGGTLIATGGAKAAGIGGGTGLGRSGQSGNGGSFTFVGGTVTAFGGEDSAGIGAGAGGESHGSIEYANGKPYVMAGRSADTAAAVDADAYLQSRDRYVTMGKAQNYVTLSLDGTIGVNFYLDLDRYAAITDCLPGDLTVRLTYNHNTDYSDTLTTDTLTGIDSSYKLAESQYPNHYRFTVPAASAQMGDEIDVVILNGETELWSLNKYTVAKFCETAIANEANDPKLAALCKALLNYGGSAQTYFGYKANTPVNAGKDFVSDLQKVTQITSSKSIQNGATGFHVKSFTYMGLSRAGVRVYYTTDSGLSLEDFNVTLSGVPDGSRIRLIYGASSSGTYIEITDIEPANMDAPLTLTVRAADGDGTTTVTYNPVSYASAKFTSTNTALADLTKSIYLYNQAAKAYFEEK